MAYAIIATLRKQQLDLESFATKHLRGSEYCSGPSRLLDREAWRICDVIKEQNVGVPAALAPSRRSVYHFPHLSTHRLSIGALDALYNAGFRDPSMDGRFGADTSCETPLLWYIAQRPSDPEVWENTVDQLSWYVAKGSNIDEFWPDSPTKGTHLLAWKLGSAIGQEKLARWNVPTQKSPGLCYWMSVRNETLRKTAGLLPEEDKGAHPNSNEDKSDTDMRQFIRTSLGDETSDLCHCHCAPSGCLPATLLYKSMKIE